MMNVYWVCFVVKKGVVIKFGCIFIELSGDIDLLLIVMQVVINYMFVEGELIQD